MNMRTITSLLALVGATLTPLCAHATGKEEVSPTGKGIVGGALLGGELVMSVEAAFQVQPAWAYIVGGVAGAAGGGIGGHFVEQQSSARVPMLMLAGGVAFAIPTVVAVLAATAYKPPAAYLQDLPPADEPLAEPPAPTDTSPAPVIAPPSSAPSTTPAPAPGTTTAPPADAAPPAAPTAPTGRRSVRSRQRLSLKLPPPALLGYQDARLALGVPNIEVREAYTRTERVMFNAPDVTEIRIPVLDVTF